MNKLKETAIDLYDAARALMVKRHNLSEAHWENLQNAAIRFSVARQNDDRQESGVRENLFDEKDFQK